MKKILMSVMAVSSLCLTGCLEEILASLCEDLAEKNSIVTTLLTPNDYSNHVAVITYENMVSHAELEISECDSNFSFPNGERQASAGTSVSFISVLDQAKESFFFSNGVANESENFRVKVTFIDNCEDKNEIDSFTSTAAQLDFQSAIEIPETPLPIVDQCTLGGQTAIVSFSES